MSHERASANGAIMMGMVQLTPEDKIALDAADVSYRKLEKVVEATRQSKAIGTFTDSSEKLFFFRHTPSELKDVEAFLGKSTNVARKSLGKKITRNVAIAGGVYLGIEGIGRAVTGVSPTGFVRDKVVDTLDWFRGTDSKQPSSEPSTLGLARKSPGASEEIK